MRLDDVTYDFDLDEWVPHRLIKAGWTKKELPPPTTEPAEGRWSAKPQNIRYSVKGLWAVGVVVVLGFSQLYFYFSSGGRTWVRWATPFFCLVSPRQFACFRGCLRPRRRRWQPKRTSAYLKTLATEILAL